MKQIRDPLQAGGRGFETLSAHQGSPCAPQQNLNFSWVCHRYRANDDGYGECSQGRPRGTSRTGSSSWRRTIKLLTHRGALVGVEGDVARALRAAR